MTLASLDYAKPLQHDIELDMLVQLLQTRRVGSYLEIGARYGGSFEAVMTSLRAGSRGVAVDFPGGHFGDAESVPILLAAIERIRHAGCQAQTIFGPSAAPEVVERVKALAPFDAVFIDGDHSYEAVTRDFELYAPMARIVILHDIAAPDHVCSRTGRKVEVPRFWRELKERYAHTEIVTRDSLMGIGVIFRD